MKKFLSYLLISICLVCVSCTGSISDSVGTYKFKDKHDRTYTLILNPNKTAIFKSAISEEFGEWEAGKGIIVSHFTLPVGYCWWPTGEGRATEMSTCNLIIRDGYVYCDMDALNAGSEYYRLPIEKVE